MSASALTLAGPGTSPALLTSETAAAEWSVWTTTARLVVTDPAVLPAARALVEEHLAEVDRAASRFRPDSEVSRLARSGADGAPVSPLLARLVAAALWAAGTTDGDVDPTVGATLAGLGYDRDLADVSEATVAAAPAPVPATTWRDVHLDGDTLTAPPGVLLDLGATAKAYAADHCATLLATRLGCGVLVSLGGDVRVAGPVPRGGWQVLVQDGDGEPASAIALNGSGAVATSSTLRRTWRAGGRALHHIVDPRSGVPAGPVWRTVSVAASTCVAANTFSTAAVVRGEGAPALLASAGVLARLVAADGSVHRVGGWPA
ncbi:MAG TPA: FAD:protein FMN transferase [Blastococcus sp.]|jgi:thiamine biosynthesis lipoprotein|nr:FAD:protein FMN transferase [Blastococcus sp.]